VAQHMELIPVNAVSSAPHLDQRAAPRMEAREMRDRVLLGKVAGWGLGQGSSHVARESPVRPPLRGLSPQAAATSKRTRVEMREERRVKSKLTVGTGATTTPEPWYARLRRRQREARLARQTTRSSAVTKAAAQPLVSAAAVAPPPPPAPPTGKGKLSREERRRGYAAKGKGRQKMGARRGLPPGLQGRQVARHQACR
jgi:hypothetical protein